MAAQDEIEIMSQPGILSDHTTRILLIFCNVFLGYPVVLVGLGGNVINILVFLRQGVSEATTISFLGLAVTDLGTILTYFWCCLSLNPWFHDSDTPLMLSEMWYLTAAYPTALFFRLTSWITILMTVERCLCVVRPVKVKQIITPKRTTATILLLFLIAVFYIIPALFTIRLAWRFHPERNRTVLGIAFFGDRDITVFEYYKDLVILFISFSVLIVVTVVLVVQIKQVSKWRQSVSMSTLQTDQDYGSLSRKDKKIVRIAVLIAVIFIICFLPDIILQVVYLINSEFTITMRYENLVFVCWSLAYLCHGVRASTNCFIYYSMSSRYKSELQALFRCCTFMKVTPRKPAMISVVSERDHL